MKTPAIVAALTVVGSLAFAAGQDGIAKRSLVVLTGAQGTPEREGGIPRAAPSRECPPGDVLSWFSPTPHIVPCTNSSPAGFFVAAVQSIADVNGDGVPEYWGFQFEGWTPEVIINGSPTSASSKIWVNRTDSQTGLPTTIRDTITIVPENFGLWLLTNFPATQTASVSLVSKDGFAGSPSFNSGMRDMDGDGDLDYLVLVALDSGTQQVWFENIGYEKPTPPLAADLNQDGNVDGIDLGMLLASWGAQS